MKKIYKEKSKIHGFGIVAGEDIKKGEFVSKLTGKVRNYIYNEKKDRKYCANWFGIGNNLWIDPSFPFVNINHSCDPNLGLKGKILFYALRDIKKGEELTFDYSTSEKEIDWKMKCICGSKKCRKFITAIQLIPRKTYNMYMPFIPTYFQAVYKKYKNNKF